MKKIYFAAKILLLSLAFFSLQAQAQDCEAPADYFVNWSNCDKSFAELSGAQLSGAELNGTNLSFANLYGALLFDVNLFGANLVQTKKLISSGLCCCCCWQTYLLNVFSID